MAIASALKTLVVATLFALVALQTTALGYTSQLKRYPYLTDVVETSATVNWGTDRSATTGAVKWGKFGQESCTAHTTTATRTAITVNSVPQYQWKATFTVDPDTQYCYRVFLDTGPEIDLLGTDATPKFRSQIPSGAATPFSFAVLGDWGEVLNADGTNPNQTNVMSRIAQSGARFALTTGDNAYNSGNQTEYGDLSQSGANLSAVFGPTFWKVPGSSIPLFPSLGNHGHSNAVHLINWPQDVAASTSGGRYQTDTYCCLNGTESRTYPSPWYAFDAGNARFYVLDAAWSNSNVGNTDLYENDYDYHWAPSTPQYQWLANDLATNPRTLKFAFFHFPLYSDNATEDSDLYLQGAASLEGLLDQHGVNIAFSGHAHTYQRNLEPPGGVVNYLTGGGGAHLQPIGANGCSSLDAYGIGWSNSGNSGSSCGAAADPLTKDRVHHFLLVSVNGSSVTVTPTDELGRVFDQVVYNPVSRDMSLTKTDSPDPVAPGQTLTYTLTASNVGTGTATQVTVTDDLPPDVTFQSANPSQGSCNHSSGTVTCNLGNVNNGANPTVQIAVVPQNPGTIVNDASVTAAETDPTPANNSATASTIVQAMTNLSISKTDSPDPVLRGQTLTYSLTASNAGPSNATGVTVTDVLPGSVTYVSANPSQGSCNQASGTVTCNLGNVNSGGNATVQITVTPQAEGSITNNASVTGGQVDPNTANNATSANTTVLAAANLSLSKTDSPDPVLRGQTLTYSLTASNAGPSNATGVTVTDVLPASVTYVSANPSQGSCNQASGTVTCNLGNVASGANPTVAITVTPQAEGSITNNASVTATQADPNTANNATSANTTVLPATNLSLGKTDSPDPVLRGQTLTYSLTASNAGPSNATGVTVTDVLPGSVTYVSANPSQGSCNQASGTVTCNLGNVNSGGNATVQITVTPQAEGPITNNANVTGAQSDPNPVNNAASANTTVLAATNLSITKTDSPDPVLRGQTLTYTLTASNAGPSNATGVTVTDVLPASVTYVSANPSQGTCNQASGTVTCNLGNVASGANPTVAITVTPQAEGPITNNASITGAQADPTAGNNATSANTTVLAATDLSLSKTDSPDPVLRGQTLTYTLTASNTGPSNATGVTVTDVLPASVTYVSANPSQGSCNQASGTVTCNLGNVASGSNPTMAITVTPQAEGPITNNASITGAQADPTAGNNATSANTTVLAATDLSLSKTDSPDPVLRGQTLTYTLTASNAGPSNATGVTVSDVLPGSVTYVSANPSQGSCNQASGTVTCNLGNVNSGGNATVQITVTPQAEGPITNNASITGAQADPTAGNNATSANTTVLAATDLSIAKTDSPDPVLRGQTLTYSLTASNAGPSNATGVTVTDVLPGSVSYVSANPSQGTCNHASGTVTCNLGNVASGANPTVGITVTPQAEGSITNNASITGAQADPAAGNNATSANTTVQPATDLSITKTDSPDPVVRGQTLTYSLTASNAGPSNATAVTVADALPASVTYVSANPSQGTCNHASGTVTCDLGNVASGASPTVAITVTPEAEGSITNVANVSGAEADPNPVDNSASEDTEVQPATDLSITKTDSPDPVLRGQPLIYSLTASNAGPSNATGVTVTDVLPATVSFESATPSQGSCNQASGTVTCDLGNVPSGESPTVEIEVTPETEGSITNSVTIAGNELDNNAANNGASVDTTVLAAADLSITKTDSPDPVARDVDDGLTYTLTAHNGGPSDATAVTVTDVLPAGVTFVSANPSQGDCLEASGVVTCDLGGLANGLNASVTIDVITQTEGTITNDASVTAAEADPISANNSASEDTTVLAAGADLSLSKTDSPDPVLRGQTLTYTLTAHNGGPSNATGVTLTDDLPAEVAYVSATPSQGDCNEASGIVTCDLGALASGLDASVTIDVVPQSEGTITNDANVTAVEADLNPVNNASSATTTVAPTADLSVTKTDSPDPVLRGQTLTYTLTAQNSGPSNATGVTLIDVLPAGMSFESATPSQGTCEEASGTVTCELGNVPNGANPTVDIEVTPETEGVISNSVTIAGTEIDTDETDNAATEDTIVLPAAADLSITKTDLPDPVERAATLTYTLTVANSGPSRATGVTVIDVLPVSVTYLSATPSQGTCNEASGTVTCTLGNVASGASPTIEIAVTPDVEGAITNDASVTAAETDPNLLNNSASEGTDVLTAAADLSITKTDSPDPVVRGQTLTYTLTATNDGPSSATGVTVTDVLPAGVTFQSANPSQGSCDEVSGTVSCPLGNVPSGASPTVQITVTPQSEGTITNDASVTATEADPISANNSASENTTVTAAADLSVTQSDSPDPVLAGHPFTYTVEVRNDGPSDATAVSLTDTLPPSVFFDAATPTQGSCDRTGATLTCDIGSLASGASATVTIDLRPKLARTLTNTAAVSAAEFDPSTANNSDAEQTLANPTMPAYPRPGSATPLRSPLVVGYSACTSPNTSHVAPLNQPSCTPSQAESPLLTTSKAGAGAGNARLRVVVGNSLTPDDDADLEITAWATDVRCTGGSAPGCVAPAADYTGKLIFRTQLRFTDLANGPFGADPGTVQNLELSLPINCNPVSGTLGSNCSIAASTETLVPGLIVEEKRTVVSVLSMTMTDAGLDGDVGAPAVCPPACGTGDENAYLRTGVFVP